MFKKKRTIIELFTNDNRTALNLYDCNLLDLWSSKIKVVYFQISTYYFFTKRLQGIFKNVTLEAWTYKTTHGDYNI